MAQSIHSYDILGRFREVGGLNLPLSFRKKVYRFRRIEKSHMFVIIYLHNSYMKLSTIFLYISKLSKCLYFYYLCRFIKAPMLFITRSQTFHIVTISIFEHSKLFYNFFFIWYCCSIKSYTYYTYYQNKINLFKYIYIHGNSY